MKTSSWIAVIGIALITFIILIASGVITFKTEPVEESTTTNSNKTSVVRIVESNDAPVYELVKDVELVEKA